jgi:hypothetical protein
LAFLFKETIEYKDSKFQEKETESLLSTEINLTTTSDEDEEYFPFFSSLTRMKSNKLAKSSHPTSELVVSLNINNEEQLLRALADT